jgi:dTMP kinase
VRGLFIAFEGVEGAGKSTQVARLAARLQARGIEPVVVREPGGTALGEEARRLVLHGKDELSPAAELFLYLVARAELVSRVVRPALTEGRIVIADRYELSSRAYQAGGRGLPESGVKAAIALATGGLVPDLYVVLDLDPEGGRGRQRAQGKPPDRIERADASFHERVAEAFGTAAGPNVIHVAAGAAPEAVADEVWRVVEARFGSHLAAYG